MLEVVALMTCLANKPKCEVVKLYPNMETCKEAKTWLSQGNPLEWAPLHCEQYKPELTEGK